MFKAIKALFIFLFYKMKVLHYIAYLRSKFDETAIEIRLCVRGIKWYFYSSLKINSKYLF